jgi:hypothetical protein
MNITKTDKKLKNRYLKVDMPNFSCSVFASSIKTRRSESVVKIVIPATKNPITETEIASIELFRF